jgi:hypothetical protein
MRPADELAVMLVLCGPRARPDTHPRVFAAWPAYWQEHHHRDHLTATTGADDRAAQRSGPPSVLRSSARAAVSSSPANTKPSIPLTNARRGGPRSR